MNVINVVRTVIVGYRLSVCGGSCLIRVLIRIVLIVHLVLSVFCLLNRKINSDNRDDCDQNNLENEACCTSAQYRIDEISDVCHVHGLITLHCFLLGSQSMTLDLPADVNVRSVCASVGSKEKLLD